MSPSYSDGAAGVNTSTPSAPTLNVTPVVTEIGALHFEGNITPHAWYHHPALRHDDGKANLVAITLLADICYWYRPTIIRDEMTGRVISVSKKFQADKLHWNHDQRAAHFGLTKRQVQDAIAFLKIRGLISVEVRERWQIATGATLYNQVFLEPVPDAIRAVSGLETVEPVTSVAPDTPFRLNGIPPTFKRDTPHGKTDTPSRSNETPLTVKREPKTENTTEISTKSLERSTLEPDDKNKTKVDGQPEAVLRVATLTNDQGSLRRFGQLYRIADKHGLLALWDAAEDSTRKRLKKSQAGQGALDRPGAYFCKTLVLLLEEKQIHIPAGSPDEREAESASIRSQIAASLSAVPAVPTSPEVPHARR